MMLEYVVDGVEWLMVSRNLVSDDGMDEADCLACRSLIGCEMDRAERMDGSAVICLACFDAMLDETDDYEDRARSIFASIKVTTLAGADPMGDWLDVGGREYSEGSINGPIRSFREADGTRQMGNIAWMSVADEAHDEMERQGCPACGDRDCIGFECD
jgi:hypothetical protein